MTSQTNLVAGRARTFVDYALFAIGAATAFVWLQSMFAWWLVGVTAIGVSSIRWIAHSGRPPVRTLARIAIVAIHTLWLYLAAVFGWLLHWSVDPIPKTIVVGLAATTLLKTIRPQSFGVPAALPIGIWITLCLLGWQREDGAIHCDDYNRVLEQPAVRLIAPSTKDLLGCTPGTIHRLARYPRRSWEAPDGRKLVVTTQSGIHFWSYGSPVSDPMEEGICEIDLATGTHRCFGGDQHKMQLILDAPEADRLFLAGWGGGRGGLFEVTRSDASEVVRVIQTDGNTGSGYYDPDTGEIGLLADECDGLRRYRASDLAPLAPTRAPFCPGETHFDPRKGEGIFCFAPGLLGPLLFEENGYLSVAFRTRPFTYELLGATWWSYGSFVWACEISPPERRAWIAIANLGMIAVVDLDSRRVIDLWPAEPGLRSAEYDRQRRRVYFTNFLRGEVIAYDTDSGEETDRWFVGRFARYVELTRDRRALWAPSSLGIARIELDH